MSESSSTGPRQLDSSAAGRPSGVEWEDTICAAIEAANIPTLLMVLVQLTGDPSWIEEPYRVSRTKGMADNDTGGLSEELQSQVRSAAVDAIVRWKRGVAPAIADPDPDLVARMLGWSMGDSVDPEYGEFLRTELAVGQGVWSEPNPVAVPENFKVVVIGGGISGIAACIKLTALGVAVVVFEKSDDIGGVWNDNRYPGAGVDTPSHLYSYSFAPGDWTQYFATRDEISAYLHAVADEFDVLSHVRFGHEVVKVELDEVSGTWDIHFNDRWGKSKVEKANVVLSCVGAFNPPVVPDIPGLEDFEGPAFHTAEWPDALALGGKSVALIGNGATAMQVAPAIADSVDRLTIFQRSPQWVQPFEKFHKQVPDPVRLLFREVPLYRACYRLRLQWIFHDKLYRSLQRDPEWSDRSDAINVANAGHRDYFTQYIKEELGKRSDLFEKVIPNYPPFGKRMLLDNGWFRTLTLPHVELVTEEIESIRSHSVLTADGREVEADVLVFATGFDVVRFVSTYDVVGRGGVHLRDAWDDIDCRAYLGLAVPGFPNFFTLYGPNTQTGHGGSLIHTVEAQLDYLTSLLTQMFESRIGQVECRRDVYDDYADKIDAMHQELIWSHPAMSTYYRNDRGRVVVINPFRNLDFWRLTRRANLDDYQLGPRARTKAVDRANDSLSPIE